MTCSSNDCKIMKFVKENLGIIINAAVILRVLPKYFRGHFSPMTRSLCPTLKERYLASLVTKIAIRYQQQHFTSFHFMLEKKEYTRLFNRSFNASEQKKIFWR